MKLKLKLKVEFLNKAVVIVGASTAEIEAYYPSAQLQVVLCRIVGSMKPCIFSGVRLMRMDGTHLVTVPVGDIFMGDNRSVDFHMKLELFPAHVEFLSKIPA